MRREVIRWLHLQRRGVPLEFFHSPVMYGGLGIRSYAGTMVDINDRRLNLLIRNNDPYAKWLVSDREVVLFTTGPTTGLFPSCVNNRSKQCYIIFTTEKQQLHIGLVV